MKNYMEKYPCLLKPEPALLKRMRDYSNGKHITKNLKKYSKLLFSLIIEDLMSIMFSPLPVKRHVSATNR